MSCRRGDHAPAPSEGSVSVVASARRFAESTRHAHFETELNRARERWQSKPGLGECTVLKEKADLALCQAAGQALAALEAEPVATPDLALPLLADCALSLARVADRVRFLSLAELSNKRRSKAPPAGPSVSTARPLGLPHKVPAAPHDAPGAFELNDGPIAQLTDTSVRLERDAVRNIGAYLEYAELPVRRSALATVKRLRGEHPKWNLLDQLLHEAWLLETDSSLKSELAALSEPLARDQSPASR